MKIVYLNLSAEFEPFMSHMKAQQETWAYGIPSKTLWIFGSTRSEPFLDQLNQRLYLPVEEKFENILEKSVEGIKWVLLNTDFDFIVRGNTSNYYDDIVLREFLKQYNNIEFFAGSELGFANQNNNTSLNTGLYLSGTGIVLSRASAMSMLDIDLNYYHDWPDDVAISHHLSTKKIAFTRIPRSDITDFKPLSFTTQYRVKSWTDYGHTTQRMHEIHAILRKSFLTSFVLFLRFNVIEYLRYARYFPFHKGANSLRHVRQFLWIGQSILKFVYLKQRRQKLTLPS